MLMGNVLIPGLPLCLCLWKRFFSRVVAAAAASSPPPPELAGRRGATSQTTTIKSTRLLHAPQLVNSQYHLKHKVVASNSYYISTCTQSTSRQRGREKDIACRCRRETVRRCVCGSAVKANHTSQAQEEQKW